MQFLILVTTLLIAGLASGQTTVFINANVVPMDQPRVLPSHTVVVEGDRIVGIGPTTDITVPGDAEIVDANGAYLMPGLADMHVHLELRDDDQRSLLLYLAEGSTTVRSLTGRDLNLQWRDMVQKGALEGPTILTAGSVLFGTVEDLIGLNGTIRAYRIAVFLLPLVFGVALLLGLVGFNKATGRNMGGLINGRNLTFGSLVLLLIGLGTLKLR